MAQATVDLDWNLPSICVAAGQPDSLKRWVIGTSMVVEGVTQAALDAAIAAYDHQAELARRAAAEQQAVDDEAARTTFRQQFQTAINRLQAIEDGRTTMTAGEVRAAVADLALILRRTLKVLRTV